MSDDFRIESYEPFLVGLRLKPNIDLNSLEKKIKLVLMENGYEIPEYDHKIPINMMPPSELLGLKNNVEFVLNIEMESFNIIGDNPEDVIDILQEMPYLIEKSNFNLQETIAFYEIHTSMVIETGKDPRDIINNSCSINTREISELDTLVSGIKINSIDEKNKLVSIIIEPRAGNPNRFYYMNLIYRSDELNDLIKYSEEMNEKVKGLLYSLEGR